MTTNESLSEALSSAHQDISDNNCVLEYEVK